MLRGGGGGRLGRRRQCTLDLNRPALAATPQPALAAADPVGSPQVPSGVGIIAPAGICAVRPCILLLSLDLRLLFLLAAEPTLHMLPYILIIVTSTHVEHSLVTGRARSKASTCFRGCSHTASPTLLSRLLLHAGGATETLSRATRTAH